MSSLAMRRDRKVLDDESVSRSESEPFGLVTLKPVMTNLPEVVKSGTVEEATSRCTLQVTRGDTGRRARKEQLGTWETRCRAEEKV